MIAVLVCGILASLRTFGVDRHRYVAAYTVSIINPQELSVAQLKRALRQRRIKTSGRKNELIVRLQNADPTGVWIQEAIVACDDVSESEEEIAAEQEEATGGRKEAVSGRSEDIHTHDRYMHDLNCRERQLADKERELMKREIEILTQENEFCEDRL